MTHVATSGTFSCATISIGGFKAPNKEMNDAYIAGDKSFAKGKGEGKTLSEFYTQILYPTSQPLGKTKEYPFEALMEGITEGKLRTKLIFACLNAYQMKEGNGYWPTQLEKWGFVAVDQTKNAIGSTNTIFIRNPSRPADSTLGPKEW